ncbi:MAG: hypothetical protein IIB38_14080, partial [Candidatus Hydrogenedentes bacterium]|nr:hypothetical protein [Candidatus Hydrogenedentota bacterium]
IEVRLPAETVIMDLTSESGPIHFYLPEDARVDLDVVATHGTIESEIPLEREVWGESVHGRSVGDDTAMHIALQTSFNTIYIHQEGLRAPVEPLYPTDAAPIERVLHETYPVAPGTVLSVHGMTGDITVRGTDRKDVSVTATQRVWVLSTKNAQVALEGLGLQIREKVGTFEVRTSVLDDLEALGCIDYQVDLVVEYPRELPVNIYAEDGNTSVQGTRGEVRIDQARGVIRAHDTDGTLHLTNRLGDIEVNDNRRGVDFLDRRTRQWQIVHCFCIPWLVPKVVFLVRTVDGEGVAAQDPLFILAREKRNQVLHHE